MLVNKVSLLKVPIFYDIFILPIKYFRLLLVIQTVELIFGKNMHFEWSLYIKYSKNR